MPELFLLLCLQVGTAQEFAFNEWEAWNSFAEGSSITFDTISNQLKFILTTKILKKEEGSITLEQISEEGTTNMKRIRKSNPIDAPPCPCGKSHIVVTESKEKVKMGERELETTLVLTTQTTCEGAETHRIQTWYSKEVPGWVVKTDEKVGGMELRQNCISYEAK